jgi:hypothetical protein
MVYDRQLQAQTATSAKDQADRLKQAEIAATKLLDEAGRPAIVRYARFKLAQIRSDMARAAGKDSEILSTWKQTALEVKGGWEELPALKALAEIQESQGSADVLTTYETMSKLTGLPPVLAQRVGYLLAAQLLRKGKVVVFDGLKNILAVVHHVHFVDGQHHMFDAHELHQVAVAACLCQHAFARIDQHQGHIGRGCACDHVACVLFVARCIGDDELTFFSGEKAVGHINGDALFTLSSEAVYEEREVNLLALCADAFAVGFEGF